MKFRPCIDIHNGTVKQIVGGTLKDTGDFAKENFVSSYDAPYYARLYERMGLRGGHIVLLNNAQSSYFEATQKQALAALEAYPMGLQIGGGINPSCSDRYLDAGASHVIVTSYVFKDGMLNERALEEMVSAVGKERLVLDLSCKMKDGQYYIVTDRWQNFTDVAVNETTLNQLAGCCDEFLVHAADVEGKASGIREDLVEVLAKSPIAVTYAGGVHNFEDLDILRRSGMNKVDVTIGSALDLFGGQMNFEKVLDYCKD